MNPEKLSFCPISALLIKLQFFLWFFLVVISIGIELYIIFLD